MEPSFIVLSLLWACGFATGLIRPQWLRLRSRAQASLVWMLLGIALIIWNSLAGATPAALSPNTEAAQNAQVLAHALTSPNSLAQQSTDLSLITEPDAGIAPMLSAIEDATSSIDLVTYELSDEGIERALAAAKARGVAVRVLLNEGYYGKQEKNADAYQYLEAHDVPVRWAPAYFALTHEKALVIDRNTAYVLTFNFTPQYYETSRDFGLIDRDQADVAAIEATFGSDWVGTKTSALTGSDLVWSPGSEDALAAFIESATSSLLIYNEEMDEPVIEHALENAARRGVRVEVLMTYADNWAQAFSELSAAGVFVRTYSPRAPRYIHAKMVLADHHLAFVGSENFSPTSLLDNRELGLLIAAPGILSALETTFASDWTSARPFAQASPASAYYTSSSGSAKYYYPSSCPSWQALSPKTLRSFSTLAALLAAFPDRTPSPACAQ